MAQYIRSSKNGSSVDNPERATPYNDPARMKQFKIVPKTAKVNIKTIFIEKSLLGMKYPASIKIGGSINEKNAFG